MNADVQELLRLLGCPVVRAPCEAEASCAALCMAGKVYVLLTTYYLLLTTYYLLLTTYCVLLTTRYVLLLTTCY